MDNENLKSCPFCGSEVILRGKDWFHVRCDKCGIITKGSPLKEKAIKEWNTRVIPDWSKDL